MHESSLLLWFVVFSGTWMVSVRTSVNFSPIVALSVKAIK